MPEEIKQSMEAMREKLPYLTDEQLAYIEGYAKACGDYAQREDQDKNKPEKTA